MGGSGLARIARLDAHPLELAVHRSGDDVEAAYARSALRLDGRSQIAWCLTRAVSVLNGVGPLARDPVGRADATTSAGAHESTLQELRWSHLGRWQSGRSAGVFSTPKG